MTENTEAEEPDCLGGGSINEDGCLDSQIFIDTNSTFQRLANNVARIFYAEEIPDNFARVLQRLKNGFRFNKILIAWKMLTC